MYGGARTRVKSSVGLTDTIPVGIGLHQGSSLSPYLFVMIMDVLARGIKDLSPWCMLYADDIVLCGTAMEMGTWMEAQISLSIYRERIWKE